MRSPNEVFFSPSGPVLVLIIALFFDKSTYLRIISFTFWFLTEDFCVFKNYFGSDIFLLLDRTLALDILHGSVNTWAQDFKANTDSPSPLIFKN